MREVEPGGPLVVQVRQRALLQFGLTGSFGVEPAVAPLDQRAGGQGDSLDARVIIGLRNRITSLRCLLIGAWRSNNAPLVTGVNRARKYKISMKTST